MKLALRGLLLVALTAMLHAATPPARPPNILLITADNLGYGDVGCYGNRDVLTPNLDALARESVRCTSFYTASPTCTVSRATLLTGRYPQRIRLNAQLPGIKGNYGIGLRHSERLIPTYLKSAGYASGCFGKWNIGFAPGSRPTERGFDEFIGNASGNIDYYSYSYQRKHDLYRGTEKFHPDKYSTNLYADSAIDFIRRKAGGPFFVYLPFNAPHYPSGGNLPKGEKVEWKAPAEFFARYGLSPDEPDEKKRYRVVITALDDAIGRVLKSLDELGLRENTLVIFYSDNGAFMLPHSGLEVASNAPMRSGGVTLWEGGIRVPAMVRWPGRLPAGTVCGEPIISTDILPTLLAVTGQPRPNDRVLDGQNILAVLAGREAAPARDLFWEFEQFKKNMSAVRRGQYKLHRSDTKAPWELYDVVNDLGETKDLAAAKPHVLQSLVAAYERWSEAVIE
ncbi:MAG: hypothetical protein EXS43_08290 [Opitutus sp.]|nr:hypothetical protein [Opitutus sp.]